MNTITQIATDPQLERLRDSIIALPEREKRAFLLARFEGLKLPQIAAELDCSVIEARAALVSAIETLSQAVPS